LTKEQQLLIAERASPMIDDLARELAKQESQKAEHREPSANGVVDPQRRVIGALGAIIKTQVSVERWDHYQHEVRKRAADRKRSTIDNLVVALDRELILSQPDRQALSALLAIEWKEEWSWSSEILTDSEAWLPPISGGRIATILSDNQRKALKKLSVRSPNPWEVFALASEIFDVTRTTEEGEIEKAAGFAVDSR
jgi:hypothetical protein